MKENVVIIGGGVAGMEAAKQLLFLGYNPIVVEQKDHLGGHVSQWNRLFPDMASAQDLVRHLGEEIVDANIFLETKVNFINRLREGYLVMLSNGVSVACRAILVASGFRLFDAARKEEYGYGVYDHVITNADLENWFNGNPDPRVPASPKKVGFVHCVGSRDLKAGNSQCSKVCCMTAVKQAIEMKEHFPDAQIYCFYMDLRLFGKKYEDFYINAQQEYGVQFIRGRVSEVGETLDGHLQVKAEDTLSGKPLRAQLDLLVLMAGMVCNPEAAELARMARLEVDSDGFLRSADNISGIVGSNRPGIFYAGACTGTKTVPETLAEARSAALDIHRFIQGK
ncbi:MAG: CoB--CoM heterodisulfide reductase iron-sulfur subunit A family protein [Bacteroidales bacterium]|nr:CoB--CoM heterodisulfide reductase iron-sulfur subunit A family protein [Bacteroidales bacterium]